MAETPLSRIENYQPIFMEYRNRWQRSLVPTRYGLKSGDLKLETVWRFTEKHMNSLLEAYFSQEAEIEFIKATDGVELAEPVTEEYEIADGLGVE